MTSTGRLKRSCFCAAVAVIASVSAVLILGFLENQSDGRNSGTNGLLLDVLGIPLAPGWLLTRGIFEKAGNLSLRQIAGPVLLALLISVVVDTGAMFGVWQLFRRVNGITNKSLSS
jgi:membrane protease YdiL (CAAX protease family)